MTEALRRLFIVSEALTRILFRDKPKADIVENMTRSFFKNSDTDEEDDLEIPAFLRLELRLRTDCIG